MQKQEKRNWLVGSSCTEIEGISLEIYTGTEEAVKELLAEKVRNARNKDPKFWEYGTEEAEDITENPDGYFDSCAVFSYYHCNFSARPVKDGEFPVPPVVDDRNSKAVYMLQDIVMSLDLTEAYEDAKWYIYRDKGFLVNDLDKVVQLLPTGSYKEDDEHTGEESADDDDEADE